MPRKKENVVKAIRRLATLCIEVGKEDDDVLGLVKSDSLQKSPAEVLEVMIGFAANTSANYKCFLALSGRQADVQIVARKLGFKLVRKKSVPAAFVSEVLEKRTEVHFVSKEVEATSIRNAARDACRQLRPGIDIYNLYQNAEALELLNVVVVSPNDCTYRRLELSEQAFRKLLPRRRAHDLTLGVLTEVNASRLSPRILNALELHSLAHNSSAPRVQLVNLWSAVECLAGALDGESIIEKVCTFFPPIVAWRRLERVIRYTAICLQNYRESGGGSEFGPGLPRSTSTQNNVDAWEVLVTVCKPEGHPHITDLLAYCSQHAHLCNSVFARWKEFHESTVLLESLSRSRQRIEWQLRRIYRARNLLVHDGIEVPQLGALLDNLQYYFSVTISRIIHGMRLNKNWDLLDSWTYWGCTGEYVTDRLKHNPHDLRVSDFFPDALGKATPHVWD